MPVDFLTPEQEQRYGRFTGEPTPDQLVRGFYFDDADHVHIHQRRGEHTRFGFALQLGTVRYLGTFLDAPTDVPPGVMAYVARQLAFLDIPALDRYRTGTVRWEHTAEIRLVRWLFTRAWIGTERPSIFFDRAVTWLISRKILLPGVTVLEREVARIPDRANSRLWWALAHVVTPTQQVRLDTLLVIPAGERLTPLDSDAAGAHHPQQPGAAGGASAPD